MIFFKKQISYKGMSDTIFRYEFLNETKEPIDFDNFTKTVECPPLLSLSSSLSCGALFFKCQPIK